MARAQILRELTGKDFPLRKPCKIDHAGHIAEPDRKMKQHDLEKDHEECMVDVEVESEKLITIEPGASEEQPETELPPAGLKELSVEPELAVVKPKRIPPGRKKKVIIDEES